MNNDKGFTLIELMICIIIVGILAMMATTAFMGWKATNNSHAVIIQQQDDDKNPQLPMEHDRYTHGNKY